MVLHFSFLELGQRQLSLDDAWFTPIVVRTLDIRTVQGGWSTMLNAYLKNHLFGPFGIASAGCPLDLGHGRELVLFAKLHCILSDGDGLRLGFDWRGSSSLKPCLKHFNVSKKDSVGRLHSFDLGLPPLCFSHGLGVALMHASPEFHQLAREAEHHQIAVPPIPPCPSWPGNHRTNATKIRILPTARRDTWKSHVIPQGSSRLGHLRRRPTPLEV